MLTKILFTLAVVVIVALVFHTKTRSTVRESTKKAQIEARRKTNRLAAYGVIGVFILGGAGFFYYNWRVDNTIISIRVTSGSETSAISYQAFRKDIKGRKFTTVDGRSVTLGDSDRVEFSELQ